MNTIRMFAFAAAVLITAFVFRVIGDGFVFEPATHTAMAAQAAVPSGPKARTN